MDGFPELDRVQNTQHRALISAAGWKLIVSQEMRGELYDLNNDPFEETNLFDEPRSRPRIRDMMELPSRYGSPRTGMRSTSPGAL